MYSRPVIKDFRRPETHHKMDGTENLNYKKQYHSGLKEISQSQGYMNG